jgi:hypothetical protein
MKKQTRLYVIFAAFVIFALTACNLPFAISQNGSGTAEATSENSAPSGGLFSPKATATPEINPRPVGIQEGLASLDSYRMHVTLNTSDSTGKYSNIAEFVERSVTDENSYDRLETTSFDPANDSEESTSTQEIYNVGLVTCTSSGDDDWTYDETTDQSKELTDIFKEMIDIVPLIDNPQFVGEETVNGIPANHFTFQVEGIGAKSGAVATVNEGEYWVALDGQYMVKYLLTLEVHSAAADSGEDTWNKLEVTIDVTDINSDVIDITLPDNCKKE